MKKGFTLAEVLITLTVIGVVAALALPNVIVSYQNKMLMSQLQRTYNMISNATSKAMSEGDAATWDALMPSNAGGKLKANAQKDFLNKYFTVATICDYSTGYGECLAANYTNLAKGASLSSDQVLNQSIMDSNDRACAVVTSGATICVSREGYLFDTNGLKGPNISGKDLFYVSVYQDGKMRLSRRDKTGDSYDGDNYQTEARGDKCLDTTSAIVNPRNTGCLSYIISHGWKFKY